MAEAAVQQRVKPKQTSPKSHHQRHQLFAGPASPSLLRGLFHSGSKNKKTTPVDVSGGKIRAPCKQQQQQQQHQQLDERPRICQDLLPHGFGEWRSTPNGSILPLVSPRSANVGTALSRPRLCEGSDLDLLATSMEEWSALPTPGGGAIDKTIYQNLVEMLPLMETFMEQKGGNKRPFTRHASMVYTPAPVRETPVKKVSESPLKSKKNKQQRAGNGKVDVKEETPVWDEQENILRRVEQDDCMQQQQQQQQQYSEAEAVIEKLNREELIQLQDQIDGLKQQLWEKDSMLKTVRSYEMAELANQQQIAELNARVDELQKLLWEKERVAQAIQSQLIEKKQDCGNVESLLDRVQQELMRKNEAAARMRDELSELRVQVSAYQFQAELHSAKMSDEEQDVQQDDDWIIPVQADELEMPAKESRLVEAARRMYLGAVITAKTKPGVESIALAAESRKRLEAFLRHPFLKGAIVPLPLI